MMSANVQNIGMAERNGSVADTREAWQQPEIVCLNLKDAQNGGGSENDGGMNSSSGIN